MRRYHVLYVPLLPGCGGLGGILRSSYRTLVTLCLLLVFCVVWVAAFHLDFRSFSS